MPLSEEELKSALISSGAVFHKSHDAIIAIDSSSKIVFCNGAALDCFGYNDQSALIGEPVETLMNAENAAHHKTYVARHLSGHDVPIMNQLRRIKAKKSNGQLFPIDIHVFHFQAAGERYYVAFIRDMSEVVAKEEELHQLAFFDPLTNLPNAVSFKNTIDEICSTDSTFIVTVLGIDWMRQINTSFGFQVGDEVIKAIVERLRAEFVNERFVGRFIGDQFVLISEIESPEQADNVLEELQERLRRLCLSPVSVSETRVKTSITAGAIVVPEMASTSTLVTKFAEMAYGDAKRHALGKVYRLRSDRLKELTFTTSLSHWLQDAIQLGEFFIVVQPKVDVKSGLSTSGEVLVRWRRSNGDMIGPDVFIPAAENTGLISAIGRYVFLETCGLLGTSSDLAGRLSKLAVNVSPEQLEDDTFCDLVESTLKSLSIAPSSLEFEVTETSVAKSPDRVIANLKRLRDMGATIALDDFGTGQSSLTMLRSMPIDRVKLDKSFIDEIGSDERSFTLVSNAVRMMHELGYLVTLEGVENREVHDMSYALGVDETQGYFYSKPLEIEAFRSFSFDLRQQT